MEVPFNFDSFGTAMEPGLQNPEKLERERTRRLFHKIAMEWETDDDIDYSIPVEDMVNQFGGNGKSGTLDLLNQILPTIKTPLMRDVVKQEQARRKMENINKVKKLVENRKLLSMVIKSEKFL